MSVTYVAEEFLRLRGIHVPLISEFTLKMSRHGEADHFIAAPVILAFGIILVLLLFPRNIAYASIGIVAVGDPIAAYVGRRFGRRFVGRKTWEGFAAGTIVAFLSTLLIVQPIVGAVGSVAGMILELSGIPDDNLTITLASAMAMYLVTAFMMLPH